MAEKVIIDIEIDGNKALTTLNEINSEIKHQTELLNKAKIGSEDYSNAAASVNKLKAAKKDLTDEMTKGEKARQKEVAAMEKEKQKMDELIKASTMDVKTEEDMIKKKNALVALRKKVDTSTDAGAKKYKEMGVQINGMNTSLIKSDEAINMHQRKVGNYPKLLSGAIVGITAAIAVIGKLTQSVKQSIDTFLRQEDANDMVNDVFGEYSSVINQAANDTQKFTKIGNEQYQELAVQAKNFGIENKNVNQTVQDAIGLADLYGSAGASEAGMLEALIDAQNGKTKGLENYVKELRGVTDEEERNRILQEKIAQGWLMASTAGATYGDQITMIKNAAGDLQEEVGKQVLEGVLGSPAEIGKVKKEIENMITAMERTGVIANMLQNLKGVYQSLIEPIADLAKRLGIASDNTELFEVILKGVGKAFEFILLPIKLVYNNIGSMITFWVKLYDILRNIKDDSFQDIFTLIKQTAFDLISPLTDLIGVSDEVAAMFGAQTDAIKMTREELDKLNVLSGQYTKNVKEMAKAQVEAAESEEEQKEQTEEQTAAIEAANKAYKSFLDTLAKINDEYELQSFFAKTAADSQDALYQKSLKTFDAYKQFFASGGYTGQELEKLKELDNAVKFAFADTIEQIDDTTDAYTAAGEQQFQEMANTTNAKLENERNYRAAQTAMLEDEVATNDENRQNEQETQQALTDNKIALREKELNATKEIIGSLSSIVQTAMDYELVNAEGNEKKIKEIRKRYALKQAAISLAEIAINTTIAASKAASQTGVGSAIAVPLMIAQGVVQAALVIAQTKKIMGMSGGGMVGFTGYGGKYEPAGAPELVQKHKGEVVFSQADVAALGGAYAVDAMRPTSRQNYYVGGIVGSAPQPVNSSAMLLDAIRQIRPIVTVQDINAVAQSELNRQQIAVI